MLTCRSACQVLLLTLVQAIFDILSFLKTLPEKKLREDLKIRKHTNMLDEEVYDTDHEDINDLQVMSKLLRDRAFWVTWTDPTFGALDNKEANEKQNPELAAVQTASFVLASHVTDATLAEFIRRIQRHMPLFLDTDKLL